MKSLYVDNGSDTPFYVGVAPESSYTIFNPCKHVVYHRSSCSVPARLAKGQGAKEIGHNLACEQPKFGHNLVRKRHKIGHTFTHERPKFGLVGD